MRNNNNAFDKRAICDFLLCILCVSAVLFKKMCIDMYNVYYYHPFTYNRLKSIIHFYICIIEMRKYYYLIHYLLLLLYHLIFI